MIRTSTSRDVSADSRGARTMRCPDTLGSPVVIFHVEFLIFFVYNKHNRSSNMIIHALFSNYKSTGKYMKVLYVNFLLLFTSEISMKTLREAKITGLKCIHWSSNIMIFFS